MTGISIIETEDVTVALTSIVKVCGSRRDNEREAVKRLTAALLGPGACVRHRDDGAPYISGGPHISITHSRDIAAIAVSSASLVGIDAEQLRPALRRVAPKFLSPSEIELFASDEDLLRAWTVKEAVYKVAGGAAFDFRNNIAISPDFASATASGLTCRLHSFAAGNATVTIASHPVLTE